MYIGVPSAKPLLGKALNDGSLKDGFRGSAVSSTKDSDISGIGRLIQANPEISINVFLPGDEQYKADIYHWASSSSQNSICTVQADTAGDISNILKYVAEHRLSLGVKSGGHTANPGFSSSPGILISMKRFDQVVYQASSQTAVIGAGQVWDNVYDKLAQHNVTVLGARVSNIGVAGFLLGGGYSWYTNQFGLAIDTIVAFQLVKPDGTIVDVTHESDPDLFFALRGGGNNFGIVTNFTMKTFPQGQVWGGSVLLAARPDDTATTEKIKKLFFALQRFIDTVEDKKAAVLASLGNLAVPGVQIKLLNLVAFYDGPSPPAGIFDVFQEIAPEETREQWRTRNFLDLVKAAMPYEQSAGSRGAFHTVSLSHYTSNLLEAIWKENEHWFSNPMTGRFLLSYSVEPLLPDILSHSAHPSAYPDDRSVAFSPFPVYVSWGDPNLDNQLQEFTKIATGRIREAAEDDNIQIGRSYPNYAIIGTPLNEMYGFNVERLNGIKERVDSSNVMGLAGGFRF